jgi:membrane protein YqaA with SNARE-associated domain
MPQRRPVDTPHAVTPLPDSPGAADPELDAYIRRNLFFGAVALVGLVGTIGMVGVLYEAELFRLTQIIHATIGLAGLAAILFVSDAIITPIPPDALLVIIAKSDLRADWLPLTLGMGLVSVAAGNTAWLLGSKLGDVPVLAKIFGRLRAKNEHLIARYGAFGVVLGALTPIPFSVTCWTAGLLKMRFALVFAPTLLRIPRFFVYYVLIAYSDRVMRAFF